MGDFGLQELEVDETLNLGHMSVRKAAPCLLALGGADEGDEIAETAQDGLGDGSGLEAVKELVGALLDSITLTPVSYTHLRAHETVLDLVCRLLLEKKKS
eukprot:TRINITY_DN52123_c0_g1_i2.p1 TRINITY_DN52123_c0_g1~~TRINITY_DN52123_c0_g1_i2.p1  ORF type:complete len:100 (-),score=0.07 TRINITY_DN52123_c0_g1_i2:20-319(-)